MEHLISAPMTTVTTPLPVGRYRRTQPKHFWNLAFTEMWERFSYYGLSAVLTYYLIYTVAEGGLGMNETAAVSIVGAYGGALYLAQLLGAWLADRVVSARRLVFWGAVIITAGHVSLALLHGIPSLALGIVLIAVGTGLLKTNITSIIGVLFGGWSREARDSGFSYFYLSINLGAILGPLATGWLQSNLGFHWAFGIAAVGMTAALIQYSVRMRALPAESDVVPNPIAKPGLFKAAAWALLGLVVVALLAVWGVIRADNLNYVVGVMIAAAAISYFAVILSSKHIDGNARKRVRGYIPLWLAETLYYGFYLQLFTTVPLIVTARVDLDLNGWIFPEGWFSVVGTIALVLIIPLIATVWKESWIGRLLPAQKFPLGFLFIGSAYLLLITTAFSTGKTVPVWLIIVALVLAGISEVFVGPIGFSVVTRIAPGRFKTQLVALKILTLGAGSTLAALFATLYTIVPELTFFVLIGGVAVLAGIAVLVGARSIHRALDTGIDETGEPLEAP
ncbi:peptide MFS transporter [Leucobacter tenebrionis]|uniref:peptide MFS transporter n=1 Tax=Leucobacter tenebrionis TaxID=2873270 RepID=UPI001CA7478E|nr:oligopeptide:H+ symporter [Leucobacter tenebrionis]QZY53192.1 oligopeptide:H+ symporter [Leucobacter tenebrionis]